MKVQQLVDLESLEVYHSFWDHYLRGEIEEISSLLGSSYTQVGSLETDDFFNKKDAIRFLQDTIDQMAGKVEMRNRHLRFQTLDHLILVHERCDLFVLEDADWNFYSKLRASTLLEHHQEGWKIIHRHSSLTELGNPISHTTPAKKVKLENHLLREAVKQQAATLEQKNKDLENEAAIVRIQRRAMSLRQSKDFHQVLVTFFEEINSLNIERFQSMVWIFNPEEHAVTCWLANPESEVGVERICIPFVDHSAFEALFKAWMERKSRFHYVVSGELKKSWDAILVSAKERSGFPLTSKDELPGGDQLHYYSTAIEFGLVILVFPIPLSEEKIILLERFGRVFEQIYTRYVDILQAENREKEAIKQFSLDRVRAEIASMRNSKDLNRIIPLVWRELIALGVPFFRCGVFIINEKSKKIQVYLSSPDGQSLGVLNLAFNSNYLTQNTLEFWKKGKIYKEYWTKDDFVEWMRSMMDLGQIQNPETYQGSAEPPESLNLHFVPFSQGMLYVGSSAPLSEKELGLVKSLADSFSIAYARYLDFERLKEAKQKAENTLSELKATQSQLIQSEKLASLGKLTAGIAHEIQNPLNFVNNFSELSMELTDEINKEIANGNLEEVKNLANQLKENLSKIKHHGKRAGCIVEDMLHQSRKSEVKKELTDLNQLIAEYLRVILDSQKSKEKNVLADTLPVEVHTDLDPALPKINVSPQELGLVLIHMMMNAFSAVREKAKINSQQQRKRQNLTKSERYIPRVQIKSETTNLPSGETMVKISVADNGPGFPESIKEQFYPIFFKGKKKKEEDFGLSQCYAIVKSHGGEMTIDSKKGKGSILNIQFPLLQI
ncbi:ATP-binding protein [Algoriphagus sp. AK58]|uniref:ATP-binding protein n=1 Tax=Algoriphagus sp. AK58 TaxID=1406877 RepID=UPI00164F2AB4|nr:ATP-binding protein [Algoriphagus sp. AK58]MBC6365425.1 hypothetical protein [Algoriphagus sp. AK58]